MTLGEAHLREILDGSPAEWENVFGADWRSIDLREALGMSMAGRTLLDEQQRIDDALFEASPARGSFTERGVIAAAVAKVFGPDATPGEVDRVLDVALELES